MSKPGAKASERTAKLLREERGLIVGKAEMWIPSHAARDVVDAACAVCVDSEPTRVLRDAVEDYRAARPGVRKDLFGFADWISLGDGYITAWQATTTPQIRAHVRKMRDTPEIREAACEWLKVPGGRIVLIGWQKYPKAVERKFWRPTELELTLESLGS